MFRGRLFGAILIVLLIIGLLSIGGYLGWSQGFAAGSLAAAGGDGIPAPRGFYGPGFFFFPLFLGFGLFFKLGLFLLLLLLIGKLFGFWTWRMAGRPPGYGWGRHWHKHGSPPPWYKDQESPSEARDQSDAGPAETKTQA
jgi:hypothetical protein